MCMHTLVLITLPSTWIGDNSSSKRQSRSLGCLSLGPPLLSLLAGPRLFLVGVPRWPSEVCRPCVCVCVCVCVCERERERQTDREREYAHNIHTLHCIHVYADVKKHLHGIKDTY